MKAWLPWPNLYNAVLRNNDLSKRKYSFSVAKNIQKCISSTPSFLYLSSTFSLYSVPFVFFLMLVFSVYHCNRRRGGTTIALPYVAKASRLRLWNIASCDIRVIKISDFSRVLLSVHVLSSWCRVCLRQQSASSLESRA